MNSSNHLPRTPWLALLLSIGGIVLTVFLVQEHLTAYGGDAVSGPFCGGGGHYDCGKVAAHPSSWFLGLPTAAWGMMMYVVLAGLSLLMLVTRGSERAAAVALGTALITLALLIDVGLAYVMLVHINTVCVMCVISYVINLGLAAVFWSLVSSAGKERSWRGLFLRWLPLPATASAAEATITDNPSAPVSSRGAQIDAKLLTGALTAAGLAVAAVITSQSAMQAHSVADFESQKFYEDTDTVRVDMSRFEGQPTRGPAGAPVQVVVIGDFQCAWCRGLSNNMERLREEFPDRIRVTFVNSPLSPACNPMIEAEGDDPHTESCVLSELAECATLQGKFWEYHDFLYDRIPLKHVTPMNVERLLPKMGLDVKRAESCLTSNEARAALDRDVAIFNDLRMSAAPGLIVNGRMKTGGISPRALRTIVLKEMKAK